VLHGHSVGDLEMTVVRSLSLIPVTMEMKRAFARSRQEFSDASA